MTKKDGIFGAPISRRSFLKGSLAAAAAVSASSTMAFAEEQAAQATAAAAQEQVFCGVCRGNCAGGCFLNVHVRDGKVVRTSMKELPNPAYNRICIKGLTHPYRMYGADRLKYPLRRVGERGAGEWEQITWDEAIKEISDRWKGYQAEFGTQSVGVYTGSGNYATCSGCGLGGTTSRFINTIGAANVNADVDLARGTGAAPVISMGPLVTGSESADLLNAKTILVWGANPVNSQQQTTHFILEAKDNGTKIVCIDPVYTGTAAKSDIYVPVRPGTDAVLAMAMMNVIFRDDLVDWAFVKEHTDACMLVRKDTKKYLKLSDVRALAEGEADAPVVMGEDGTVDIAANVANPATAGTFDVNGISVTVALDLIRESVAQYTPEKAQEICGVEAAQIEEITALYAKETPATIYTYFGMDHYVNGLYGYRATAILAAITGNLGKPGAFCGMNEALATNCLNLAGTAVVEGGIYSPITLPWLQIHEILETGKFAGKDVNFKSLYVSCANVIGCSAERQTVLDIISKIEFLVVSDLVMTETAKYADILLPAAHWFEVNDAFVSYSTHPYVLRQEKAVELPYECRPDYEILRSLAVAMGYENAFPEDSEDYIKLWLDTDAARALGLTYEDLLEKKAIRFLPGENFVFAEGGNFATATGRAHLYNETPKVNIDFGQEWDLEDEHLPKWLPPHEAWHENEKHEKYPFVMLQVHAKWFTHSQWFDVPVLREVSGEPTVHMNPADAETKGIANGDVVKVYNDRGYVVMKAEINSAVQPGAVTVPHGWEYGQFIEGHYQDMTSRVMHPMINNSAFFDVLCNVEKV